MRTLKRDVRRDPIISVTVTHPTKGDTLVTKEVPRPVYAYPTAPTVAGSYRRLDLKPAPDRSVGGLHRTLKRDVRNDPIISVTVTHPTKGDTLVTKAVPRPVYAYPTISGNVDF